ncbi:hypothetical protein ACO0SA_003233 [Hanseniaspora valbyensis]
MGLFNKLFSSNNNSTTAATTDDSNKKTNPNNTTQRKRSSSVSINNIIKKESNINNNSKSTNTIQYNSNNNKRNDDNDKQSLPRLKKAITTGQFPASKIDMKQFLDYWKNENLIMFHGKEDFESKQKTIWPHGKEQLQKKQIPDHDNDLHKLKSCFKKGSLLEHKKRLLMCQQSDCKPPQTKTRSNIAKLFLSKNNNSNNSNNTSNYNNYNDRSGNSSNNSSTSSLIPLRKWSSQPVNNVDKECEYDMLGMQDYYDNEDHPTEKKNSLSRSNSLLSVSSSNSDDEYSDSDGLDGMPVISPITSADTSFIHEAHLNKESELQIPPGLENVSIPKHIHFDKTVFSIDPPQQICSKQPRVGEVEVQNGCVIVHNNNNNNNDNGIEKSSLGMACKDVDGVGKGSHGLTVGGRGVLKILSDVDRENLDKSLEWRYFKDLEKAHLETIRNNNHTSGIYSPMGHSRKSSLKIDMNEAEKVKLEDKDFAIEDDLFPDPCRRVSWRTIYQRVCHLREILPIASIMQQIPIEEDDDDEKEGDDSKDKKDSGDTESNNTTTTKHTFVDYIPMITLKNNKPSVIEILTICDFISCSIIESLSFDMCDLSVDMFSRILDAVSRMIMNLQNSSKKEILSSVKLSFRNTPIDDEGWKIFSKFLSTFNFQDIRVSLDISLAPGLKCNVLRKKNIHCTNDKVKRMSLSLNRNKGKNITELNDFDYNMTSRNKDWPLFIASIACNTSLKFQQLFINNCGIFSSERENYSCIVQNFFETVGIKTIELGLSKTDIEELINVAAKSKNGDPMGLPQNKIAKCEVLSHSLLDKFNNKGVTKFNIRDLLLENNILDDPRIHFAPMQANASKRNILIDHALLDDVDGEAGTGRSFSLRGDEDEIIPIFSKSCSSGDFDDKEFGNSFKGSHEDLLKLNNKNIRDMIKH